MNESIMHRDLGTPVTEFEKKVYKLPQSAYPLKTCLARYINDDFVHCFDPGHEEEMSSNMDDFMTKVNEIRLVEKQRNGTSFFRFVNEAKEEDLLDMVYSGATNDKNKDEAEYKEKTDLLGPQDDLSERDFKESDDEGDDHDAKEETCEKTETNKTQRVEDNQPVFSTMQGTQMEQEEASFTQGCSTTQDSTENVIGPCVCSESSKKRKSFESYPFDSSSFAEEDLETDRNRPTATRSHEDVSKRVKLAHSSNTADEKVIEISSDEEK